MKPSKAPFWWIIRNCETDEALCLAGRRQRYTYAADAAADCLPGEHVVRVHARIPEPKLPAWVKPIILGDERHLVGVRRVYPDEVVEYVFHVADNGALAAVDLWQHTPNGKRFRGGFTAAPPGIWAEAAARAARMLRARKAGK